MKAGVILTVKLNQKGSKISLILEPFVCYHVRMKDIQVRSKGKAADFYLEDAPWACISIVSPGDDWPQLVHDNRLEVLRLQFKDVDKVREQDKGRIKGLFNDVHADKIWKFVESVKDRIDTLLVHCEAGLSRSPGVAAAIAHVYLCKEAEQSFFDNYTPNRHVYRTLLEHHYDQLRFRESLTEPLVVPELLDYKEKILDEPSDCKG